MADDLSQWWDEDADRINKMADAARKMAVKLPADKEDRWEDAVEEERAWCATGPGGGLDNSCGGSGGASGSPVLSIEKLVEKIASNPDGFTLDPLSAESPPDGIMVSEFQNDTVRSVTIKASDIESPRGVKKLSEWVSNNADLLVGQADRFIGGWRAGEDFYIDVSTRFPPEKAAEALESGRKSGQLAVFNLGTVKETWVHYDRGDDRKPAGYDKKFAKARKESQEKQVYDPDTPAIQDEDWAKDLSAHGKTTVRAYNHQSEEDENNDQTNSAIRREGQGHDHRDVSRNANVFRESGRVEGQEARPSVVRRRPGSIASPVEGSARSSREHREASVDCGRGPGGIFGPGNKCQDEGSPSDAFGNAIDGAMRSPSSTMGGGGSGTSWKKLDTPSVYDAERLKIDPPAPSLSEVNTVAILNGRTLSASLKEVGVTLDQAAKVCGNLSPESNVVVAHGTLKEITNWIDNPDRATDPESSVTVVSKQPFGGVEDAIGTAATLSRTDDDELLLSYVMFSVAPEAQRDNPIAVARGLYSGVVKSINEAEKVGVEEVGMLAAGSDSNDEFKGYRIWPRLGFDGIIPRNKITPTYSIRLGFFEKYGSNLPDEILSDRAKQEKSEGALTIQSLYDTKEGQRWWEENGGAMPMFLRIGDNEDSGWQRFKRISGKVSDRDIIDVIDVEWRAIRGEAEERGFCPTGEGNGVDNSCGSGGKMAPDRDGGGGSVAGSSVGAGKPASVTVESQDSLDKAASVLGLGGVDDVVKISGANVRGAKVDVYADPSGFTKVSALWPIDKEDPDGGGKVFTEVSMANTPEGKVLGFEAFGPSGGSISSGADQQKVISIISEKVAESIESAEENGFVAVTTFAVGDANNQYKGYRLWPQFGFDADLPRDLAKRVPPEIVLKSKGIAIPPPGSTSIPHHLVVKSLASQNRDMTIQELIKTREGKRWWDDNGDDIELKLDLTDKSSLGYKKWSEVKDRLPALRERNQTRSFFDAFVEERGFCPTGEGGGILNTCGNDDGGPTDAFGGSVGGFERSPSATKQKKGGGGDSAPAEPLVWRAGEPHPDLFAEAVSSNVVTRSADGKIESTTIPGAVISPGFAGQPEIDPVTVGRYLAEKQSEHRGRVIDTATEGKPLEGDDFEYMVTGIVSQIQSATARGVAPNFYSPEDRQKQLDEYAKIQPLMRGGRTASGRCIGEEGPNGECEPSEGISPHAEFLFRAAQALTSPMATPKNNMLLADQVITRYFTDPNPSTATLGNGLSMPGLGGKETAKKFARLQGIIDTIGMEETRKLFSQPPMPVRDFQKYFESKIPGSEGEKFTADYYADEVVPLFSIFGPKVGPFFANNMGDHDPLTADLWFSRTWGRLSGELIKDRSPETAKKHATSLMESTKDIKRKELSELGIDGRQFRTIVSGMKKTGVVPSTVIDWAERRVKQYAKDGHPNPKYGTGTESRYKIDRLAVAILNNETKALEAPQNGMMRRNMIKVMREASARAKMPIAYMQDVLWQDEQDAWGTLGTRTSTEVGVPSLYSDVMKQIASGQIKRREVRAYIEQEGDGELRYLSDQPGGIEQALFDVMLSEMDDDVFVELAVSLLRRNAEDSADALEFAKNTVDDLRAVGLTRVEMPKAGLDGLHVMGFDAEIPSDLVEMLPESLSHCQTLLDLHVSSEGQEWWKENGRDIDVSIALDGVQGQIFDSFTAGKRWEDIIEEGILDDYGNS